MKTIKTSLLALLFTATALFASGQGMVTVYSNDFNGADADLGIGKYNHMTLLRAGVSVVRSVKVPAGMQVTLYEKDNFEGTSLVLLQNANMKLIEGKGFGKITMNVSIVVEKAPESVLSEPLVTIYRDIFSGPSLNLRTGYYDHYELGIVDNDKLSSVKVPKGMKVTLYEHGGYTGRSIVLTEDASAEFLKKNKFNDIASSIRVEVLPEPVKEIPKEVPVDPAPVVVVIPVVVADEKDDALPTTTGVTLYQDNFMGLSHCFEPGYYYELYIGNDELSSVKVTKGLWVLLFEHSNFQGRSLLLTQDASEDFITGKDFNNTATSLIVGNTDIPLPVVTLFDGDREESFKKLTPGEYPLLEVGNNILSSVEIPRGLKVTLFENAGYEGRSMEITKSVGTDFMNKHAFDNLTSSIIIEQRDPRDLVVKIYSDSYKGFSQDLTPGKYYAHDIEIGSKDLTSLKVPRGMQVELFANDNLTGTMGFADRDTDFTGFKVFDNYYSSLIVKDVHQPVVTPIAVPVPPPLVEEPKPIQEPIEEAPVAIYNYDPPCEMNDDQFQNALRSIESKPFSDEKMEMVTLVTKDKCLTNDQIRAIARQFGFEEQTLEFVKSAYDNATQKDTYYLLEDVFKFSSSKDAFRKFLKEK
jgi:hypothetical protein